MDGWSFTVRQHYIGDIVPGELMIWAYDDADQVFVAFLRCELIQMNSKKKKKMQSVPVNLFTVFERSTVRLGVFVYIYLMTFFILI